MAKKIKKMVCLLVAVCMTVSVLCMTASAESGSYNGRTYSISLMLNRTSMTSQLAYPTTIQLGFLGYAEASFNGDYEKRSCANNGMSTRVSKTVYPTKADLQFYHGYQEYYCNSHFMQTVQRNLTRL